MKEELQDFQHRLTINRNKLERIKISIESMIEECEEICKESNKLLLAYLEEKSISHK